MIANMKTLTSHRRTLCLLFGLSLILGCSQPAEAPNLFVSDTHSFSIEFPPGWDVSDTPLANPVVSAYQLLDGPTDYFRENISVSIDQLQPGDSLDAYYDANIRTVEQHAQLRIYEKKLIQISGVDCFRVDSLISVTGSDFPTRGYTYLFVKDGKGYGINTAAEEHRFESVSATFDRAAMSFKFK